MTIRNSNPAAAAIFNVSGVFADNWCGPSVSFSAGINSDISIVELALWLRPEEKAKVSKFSIGCGDFPPVEFDIFHEVLVRVQLACRGSIGDVIETRVHCNNIVTGSSEDKREISFRLEDVIFS